ncbi:hypothetical protein ACFTTN_03535 [Streptomyces niveus]|uniref:hypothetical protein n=1 Tax=Streptomyces niveus TaxID=193462 RepID=UPI00363EA755
MPGRREDDPRTGGPAGGLASVDVAAVVYTVRYTFARRHILAEARRHLMETLRGRALEPGLDDHIADKALCRARQLTVPQKGRRVPWPARWWIASTDGKPPRAATRYERARVASLALQNAIRATRAAPPATRDEATAATASAAALTHDHHHDQAATVPHAVDHPERDATLTPAQRAAAVHAHQQAAMPEELEGRTTDPATWANSPKNLARFAAYAKAADARRRAVEDHAQRAPAPATDPGRQQHQHPSPEPGHGPTPGARP